MRLEGAAAFAVLPASLKDAALDPAHKDKALRQWEIASSDRQSFKAAFDRFDNNQPFDPNDHEDRKNADRIFQSMGGDDTALTAVIERTGIFPDSAAIKMRGDLISDDRNASRRR